MTIVPYFPIPASVLREITALKLSQIAARMKESHGTKLTFAQNVIDSIVARCEDVDTGARNIDHIVREHILPVLASRVLQCLAEGEMPGEMRCEMGDQGYLAVAVPATAAAAG